MDIGDIVQFECEGYNEDDVATNERWIEQGRIESLWDLESQEWAIISLRKTRMVPVPVEDLTKVRIATDQVKPSTGLEPLQYHRSPAFKTAHMQRVAHLILKDQKWEIQ